MPSFVSTKADMIINGILPIDQMKDCVPPVNLISLLHSVCMAVVPQSTAQWLMEPLSLI